MNTSVAGGINVSLAVAFMEKLDRQGWGPWRETGLMMGEDTTGVLSADSEGWQSPTVEGESGAHGPTERRHNGPMISVLRILRKQLP